MVKANHWQVEIELGLSVKYNAAQITIQHIQPRLKLQYNSLKL